MNEIKERYLKNTLWQKINKNIQACEALLPETSQIQKANLILWLYFWKREQQIIELETDAHHTSEQERRRLLLKEMAALINLNKELKRKLKKIKYE